MADWLSLSDLPDPKNREEVDTWLLKREEQLADRIAKALDEVVTNAYDSFLSTLTASGDLSRLDSIIGEWTLIASRDILPDIEETYLSGAISAYTQAPGTRRIARNRVEAWADVVNTQAVEYMTTATNRMSDVGRTVWRDIRDKTTTAISQGKSTEELKSAIEELGKFSEYRADTIARTETNAAYINGDWNGALALGEYGPVEKTWVATFGPRTRPSHASVSGTTIPMAEPFSVGGVPMMYPQAPDAPAGEVVNCRCHLDFYYAGETRPDGTVIGLPEGVQETVTITTPTATGSPSTTLAGYGPGPRATQTFTDTVVLPAATRGQAAARVKALKTVAAEIDRVHGLPDSSMGNIIVKLGGSAQNKGGHFTPRTRAPKPRRVKGESVNEYMDKYRDWMKTDLHAEILVTGRDDLGGQMFTMAHELGHRVDWDDVGWRTERVWRSDAVKELQAKYKADWLQHLDEVTDPEARAILEMARIAREAESMRQYTSRSTIAYRQYFYDIKEIWARAYSQWIVDITENPEMTAALAEKIQSNFQFSPAEMAMLRPHIETVLRTRGLMK